MDRNGPPGICIRFWIERFKLAQPAVQQEDENLFVFRFDFSGDEWIEHNFHAYPES